MAELALKSYNGIRTGVGLSKANSIWMLIVIIPIMVALLDGDELDSVLRISVEAFGGTLPYIAVAVLLIAYLKATGAEAMVAKAFAGREMRMIFLAAVIGGLAPFCSCEVIPFVAGLLAVGAPISAVMAFWLSSPLIDPPTVLITAGALGWQFAIGKIFAAVALGLMGGFGVKLLMRQRAFAHPLRNRTVEGCGACGESDACEITPFESGPKWRFWRDPMRITTFRSEAGRNALFLAKWLALAYLLEALLITYVSAESIGSVVGGDGFIAIVIGAIVGAPAYINSYAAPALVDGLIEQGMGNGAAMAFMVAGAISSVPAMAAVWSLVNRWVFLAYMGFGIAGAIIIGTVFAAIM